MACSVAEGVGDMLAFDGVPDPVVSVGIEVAEEWLVGWSIVLAEMEDDAAHGFDRSQVGISGGGVDDLLAANSILLVSESQRHDLQGLEIIHVIQGERRVGA